MRVLRFETLRDLGFRVWGILAYSFFEFRFVHLDVIPFQLRVAYDPNDTWLVDFMNLQAPLWLGCFIVFFFNLPSLLPSFLHRLKA